MSNLQSIHLRSRTASSDRIVGIDVRPRSFAFIVLEGITVLDCGGRTCIRAQFVACLGQRFRRILEIYGPSVIAMRAWQSGHPDRDRSRQAAVEAVMAAARICHINIVELAPSTIRRRLECENATDKGQIARMVATILPELEWKLPPQRKPWEGEHYRTSIFDAAAAALAYLAQRI